MIKIVVARYNEDIEWTKEFNNLIIVNKGNKIDNIENQIYCINVGREGHTYYSYIYDNYDNLDDYIVFLQGNPFDHSPNIIKNLKEIVANPEKIKNFYYLSEWIIDCNLSGCNHHAGLPLIDVYEKIFKEKKENMKFSFGAGAQFAVSKLNILKHPKSFYKNIVDLLSYDINPIEGFCIERFHSIILNNDNNILPNNDKSIIDLISIYDERTRGLMYFLYKCSKKYNDINIINININTQDRGNNNINIKEYTMCYNKNYPNLSKFCGPDCFFYGWPSANISSFEETKNKIINNSNNVPTINKVGWYGNIQSPLSDTIEFRTRPLLYMLGQKYPELLDIINVYVSPMDSIINEKIKNYLPLEELTKYKYLIDIGGNGWSGRLKWLLYTKRPLLLVDRIYIEYFYNDLIPYFHYIPVNMDLSNLMEQVKWIIDNPEKANNIALNAFKFASDNFTEEKLLERVYFVYKNIIS